MKMYVKGYTQRAMAIVTTIAIILLSSLLCYGLFHKKLYRVAGQLNSYNSADYSIIYILNYGEWFDNECLYPDTDIQIYLDANKTRRMTVSSVMRNEKVTYDLTYLAPLSGLVADEMCISENVADTYNLDVGDTLYVEYPYSVTPEQTIISDIMQAEYDYVNPIIDNNVGVVFLGFNEKYAASTKGNSVLFAEKSRADELSAFPQIINSVINKSECIATVSAQGTTALLFSAIFALISARLTHILFFSKSYALLYRCYLKGMSRTLVPSIQFVEKILFCLLPCIVIQQIITSRMPESFITRAYKTIPICIFGLYCIITFIVDLIKLRKKGG